MNDQGQTKPDDPAFDFEAFSVDAVFHERRKVVERRSRLAAPSPIVAPTDDRPKPERRARKERRRRIDPTTFEKQYTDDELEFMNAMQHYKVQSGKSFPSHGDVLRVAFSLGYRKLISVDVDVDVDVDHDPEEPAAAARN